jgi:hypothetical protein
MTFNCIVPLTQNLSTVISTYQQLGKNGIDYILIVLAYVIHHYISIRLTKKRYKTSSFNSSSIHTILIVPRLDVFIP